MLQAEIVASTSGQTAACRRSYASIWSGFRPMNCPILRTRLSPFTRPLRSIWIGISSYRRRVHGNAISRRIRWNIAAIFDDDRVDEMLVQVRGVLDHPVLQRAANSDVVED